MNGADLVVLAADKNIEAAMAGILSRHQALQIRPVTSKTFVHPERDPGCYRKSHGFLRPMTRDYSYALVVFDRIGSGQERKTRTAIEQEVLGRLASHGWRDRAGVIVIDPELENWVWSTSNEVARCLGWRSSTAKVREWLSTESLWPVGMQKPPNPKEAAIKALRRAKMPRSSAVFEKLARTVSLDRCQDESFQELREQLVAWFGTVP